MRKNKYLSISLRSLSASLTGIALVFLSACTPEFNYTKNLNSVTPAPSPTAEESEDLSVKEDQSGSGTLRASGADGNNLTFSITSKPKKGTVELNASTGAYVYTPNKNENGTDSFTFKVSDGVTESVEATVNITIQALDDSPVASGVSATVVEDTQGNAIRLGYTDTESDPATACTVSSVVGGSVSSCGCNSGVCSAIFSPSENLSGSNAASFNYTVTANGAVSESARLTVSITSYCDGMTQDSTAPFVTGFSYVPDGTSTKPYRICTSSQMNTIQATSALWDKYFKLKKDVDITTLPGGIGTAATAFTGTFDGGGYKLQNYTYTGSGAGFQGLFFSISSTAVIKNLGVTNISVVGDAQRLGGVVGQNDGLIQSVYSTGVLTGNQRVGGVVGLNNGTIEDSYSTVAVTSTTGAAWGRVGGLIGENVSGIVTRCYATGAIAATMNAGGLIGDSNAGTIVDSYATGSVSVTGTAGVGQSTGGLIGVNTGGAITRSYATGHVSSQNLNVGGLIGTFTSGTITDSYATGNVTTTGSSVGGLVGNMAAGTISGSNATGSVSQTSTGSYVGGLIGYALASTSVTITNSFATGAVTSSGGSVGGLMGRIVDGTVTGCYAMGAVTKTGAGNGVGGLIGTSANAVTVTSSYAEGSVTNSGGSQFTGGLVGDGAGGSIVTSYSTGNVSSTGIYVGGLVGYQTGGTTSGSNASGTVTYAGVSTGLIHLGGLAGTLTAGTISNSFATGNVSGGSGTYVGGLAGSVAGTGTVSGSYATGAVSSTNATTSYLGGLIGMYSSSANLTNVYATGAVAGAGEGIGGLIGAASAAATIASSYATGNVTNSGATNYTGGLVGSGPIIASSCYATGTVTSGGTYVGGLIGNASSGSAVSSSYATGTVTGVSVTGGLIGRINAAGTLATSYATGNVTGTGSVGGLIGSLEAVATVNSSYATGSVSGTNDNIGGLIGRITPPSTGTIIQDSYATGTVTAINATTDSIGGLVGAVATNAVTFQNVYATGDVSAPNTGNYTGGLIGNCASCTLSQVWASGDVTGGTYVGGLIGTLSGTGPCTKCVAMGNVRATAMYAGGISGSSIATNSITDSWSFGNVVSDTGSAAGGVYIMAGTLTRVISLGNVYAPAASATGMSMNLANSATAQITDSYSRGNVWGTNAGGFGGAVGGAGATVSQSFATGTVESLVQNVGGFTIATDSTAFSDNFALGNVISGGGHLRSGGFAGSMSLTGSFTRTYARGNVTAIATTDRYGSFIGQVSGPITQSYATGSVDSTGMSKGGFMAMTGGTVTSCFWNGDASAAGMLDYSGFDHAGIFKETATNLKTQATYTAQGWDFVGEAPNGANDYWVMPKGVDGSGYPRLTNSTAVLSRYYCYGAALTNAPFAAGAGTFASPYVICTAAQFQALSQNSAHWDKNFLLGEDVDLSGIANWTPIGNATTPFSGAFDGLFYNISGLNVSTASSYAGLFGYVAGDAGVDGAGDGEIRNIQLVSPTVSGGAFTGAAIGYIGTGRFIKTSVTGGTVTGTSQVGGLVGATGSNVRIAHAMSSANVTATGDDVGGLVGRNAGRIQFGWSKTGAVSSAAGTNVGGFVGQNTGTVKDSYSWMNVTGAVRVGGFAGYNNGGTIKHDYSIGTVTGATSRGGLVGANASGSVLESFWDVQTTSLGTDGLTTGSDGGTGYSTANMKTQITYTNANFLFGRDWRMPYAGADYPILRSE